MITEPDVVAALREVQDPEVPCNIVDLGLVYDVRIDGETVRVQMTLTTPGCHMGAVICRSAEEAILRVPGVASAEVQLVFEPPWEPSRISPEGRKALGIQAL